MGNKLRTLHEISQQELGCLQNPCLEPKHKIFLSHSGSQKNFTAQLCEDLIGVGDFPFFDKRPDSLPKGEEFPPLLFKAARQCWVAILVLSEEFFTGSKWPMIELNEFVQAQAVDNPGLKLLPLYFGLNLHQLKDAKNQNRWRKTWEEWAKEDERIDVEKWIRALKKVVGPVNGMEYDGVDEVAFRKNVVSAVCKLAPPDVKYDVSHVQALPRLCKEISQKMDEPHQGPGCRVVGLFGTAGMGKTTISKAICNEKFGEFGGKVCHIEFSGNNYVELRKKVLQELTGANEEHLPNEGDKLLGLLKNRMYHQKVFLSLDNVLSGNDIEEAKMYLAIEYLDGSKVLVTSRSATILESLGLRGSDCMEMPELKEQDATCAFLYYARCNNKTFDEIEQGIIKECLEACRFTKRDLGAPGDESSAPQYLPLALKVWGTQLGQISKEPLSWIPSLKTLKEHRFNPFKERVHPLFSLLRQGYDKLGKKEQHIFLDLAIFSPRYSFVGFTDYNIVEWLSIIYACSKEDIEMSLNALRRKALLEDPVRDGLGFKIHDLFLEFAREEVQTESTFDKRRILYGRSGADIPRELLKRPGGGFWPSLERLGLHRSVAEKLTRELLDRCCNVEMLQLYDCHELVEVDVQGMENLISLDVIGCEKVGAKFEGVTKLKNLAWFRWRNIGEEVAPFLLDLSSLTALQVVHLDCELWDHKSVVPPNLSGCTNLRELTMGGFAKLQSFPELSNLCKLEKICFRFATEAKGVSGLSSLKALKFLSLYWCPEVTELPGLCDLLALETLELIDVGLCEIHGLEELRHLRVLIVSSSRHLTNLRGLEYLTSLRHLDASDCKKLRALPDCSNLKELEVVNLSNSGVRILPRDFGRLAKHRILKVEGCVGLFQPLVVWLCNQGDWIPRWLARWDPEAISIREDFSYYMEEVVLFRPNCSRPTLVNGDFFEDMCGSHIWSGSEMGLVEVALGCLDDIGVLSLVVASHATRNADTRWFIEDSESRRIVNRPLVSHSLCESIVRYVEELYQRMKRNQKAEGREQEHLMRGIEFIVENVTKNESYTEALVGLGICDFIKRCREEPCTHPSSFLGALNRCELKSQR